MRPGSRISQRNPLPVLPPLPAVPGSASSPGRRGPALPHSPAPGAGPARGWVTRRNCGARKPRRLRGLKPLLPLPACSLCILGILVLCKPAAKAGARSVPQVPGFHASTGPWYWCHGSLRFSYRTPAAHPGWRWRSVVTQASGLRVCAESREDDLEEIQGLSLGLSLAPVPEDCCSSSLFLVAALDSCFLLHLPCYSKGFF